MGYAIIFEIKDRKRIMNIYPLTRQEAVKAVKICRNILLSEVYAKDLPEEFNVKIVELKEICLNTET